jgi:hypothetical protein
MSSPERYCGLGNRFHQGLGNLLGDTGAHCAGADNADSPFFCEELGHAL